MAQGWSDNSCHLYPIPVVRSGLILGWEMILRPEMTGTSRFVRGFEGSRALRSNKWSHSIGTGIGSYLKCRMLASTATALTGSAGSPR
jgi:hypothetical protein